MLKNLSILITVLVFGAFPVFAYAQETATVTTGPTITTTPNKTLRTAMRKELKDATKEMRDKIMEERSAFKEKLATIKDERKQKILTNLDSRLKSINAKRTSEMSERLTRLTTILGKISTKEATLKAAGKNTATLVTAIAAAQTAIDSAKQAVTDQAAKDYVMPITTDETLKTAASTTIQGFMADLKAVHVKVVAAQTAVAKTHKYVGLLMGEMITPSPLPTSAATQ